MSEEEKKAIEELKKTYKFLRKNQLNTNVWLTLDIHNLGILLNLIEKQQKEIEELKEINKQLTDYLEDSYYVSADKIKEKIKELEQIKRTALHERTIEMMNDKIDILNLLLEED